MSYVQAVLFDKRYNTPRSAKNWLANNQLQPIKPFHTTDRYIRSRISPPIAPMRTLTLDKRRRVKAVINVGGTRSNAARTGGSIHIPSARYAQHITRRNGGAIGSDLGVGAATVGAILAAIAAKKIYDKVRSN